MKLNWLKKLFAKNEEEYRDIEQLVERDRPDSISKSKTPFRFPLIPDEEKDQFLFGEPKEEKNVEPVMKKHITEQETYRPLHTQELWQQRKLQPVVVHRAPKKEIPVIPRTPKKEIIEETITETRKKAFTPTDVPSPVFGFSKRRGNKTEESMEFKDAEQKASYKEITVYPTQVPSPVFGFSNRRGNKAEVSMDHIKTDEESPYKEETISSTQVTSPDVVFTKKQETKIDASTSIQAEQEIVTKEIAVTVVPQEVEVLEVEIDPIVSEPIVEAEAEAEVEVKYELMDNPVESVEETKIVPKENIRPFNVLMLKSDKEKMNKLIKEPTKNAPEVKAVTLQPIQSQSDLNTQSQPEHSIYARPDLSYLLPPEMKNEDREWMEEQAFTLIEALSHFQVSGEIVQMVQGPAVTQFEITVGHGTKVSKIRNLADDLKLALAAKDIRIQAPIPGKSSIGIEIPNRKSRAVRLSEVINTNVFLESDSPLEAALGLDLTGKPVTLDLRKMPHGLIAGATGSGKSVFINSLLVSLLYKATPDEVKLLLIDPKMVELAPFNHIPHLVSPVITDVKAATAALKWAVEEMERRYQLFAHIGVRDISRYNTLATEKRQFAQKLPYIVIVIDELADLMMMAPTEVEDAICRIAQKARACGIHLVLATQRPSVDVITGLIKANIPTRIAFSVSSQIDSRTILDQQGAERLLGKGDMLYQGNGMSSPVRIQGTFVTDDEIENIIDYARTQGTPEYMFEQEELLQKAENVTEQDELFEEACRFVVEQGSASTSLLQRKFHLGYNRAARLIDAMYENGYITEQKGSKAREVLLTNESLEQIFS
nr:DNA translocase FtsK [Bacillus sp. FJAT-22090]